MAAGDMTLEELNELKLSDLHKIMSYMNLPYNAKSKKADLVRIIWANIPQDGIGEVDELLLPKRMSVRLERIYKSLGRLP